MTQKDFDKRCKEVFITQEGDEFYAINTNGSDVCIAMKETDPNGEELFFNYFPDMSDREQALDYLLGKRNDFND